MLQKFSKLVLTIVLTLSGFFPTSIIAQGTDSLNVAILGDSMSWIGGDNCDKETGWTNHFHRAFPDYNIGMYARSGATWTNTVNTTGDTAFYSELLNDENVIYDQVMRLLNDVEKNPASVPDIAIIFAGGNDAWFESKRPGIYDPAPLPEKNLKSVKPSEVTSLASSIELCCKLLRESFPSCRIVLMTPPEMSKTTPERIHKVGDTIAAKGAELGLEVFRTDRDLPFNHDVEKSENRIYTYDGAHSNPTGAKLISDYVIEKLNLKK